MVFLVTPDNFDFKVASVDMDPIIYEVTIDSECFILGDTPYILYKYACNGCEDKAVSAFDIEENPFKRILRGDATLNHFRMAERIFEKPKLLGIPTARLCECGCGKLIPANAHPQRKYFDPKKCGNRKRQKNNRSKKALRETKDFKLNNG